MRMTSAIFDDYTCSQNLKQKHREDKDFLLSCEYIVFKQLKEIPHNNLPLFGIRISPTFIIMRIDVHASNCRFSFIPGNILTKNWRKCLLCIWSIASTFSLLPVLAQRETLRSGSLNRYLILFQEKSNALYPTPYHLEHPEAFLSSRSLKRRKRQALAAPNEQDLPVNPAYLAALRTHPNATLGAPSRWLNAVLLQCSEQSLDALLASKMGKESIVSAQLLAPGDRLLAGASATALSAAPAPEGLRMERPLAPLNATQNEMLGMDQRLCSLMRGQDILIAVLDGGFNKVNALPAFSSLLARGGIMDHFDFVSNTKEVFHKGDHGTSVLSVMAAQSPSFQGLAPQASYALYITEDGMSEYRIEEYNWIVAAERADSLGADIIHTSLGYKNFDADTMNYTTENLLAHHTLISRGAAWAADRGMFLVTSMGNDGVKGLSAPADVLSGLSVAAVDPQGSWVNFSSVGLEEKDSTYSKPDVAAMGTGVLCYDSHGLAFANGTSLSAPLITGLVASLWSCFPDMKAETLAESIREASHQSKAPDKFLGHGIPNARKILASAPLLRIADGELDWKRTAADTGLLSVPLGSATRLLRVALPFASREGKDTITLDVQHKGSRLKQLPVDTQTHDASAFAYVSLQGLAAGKHRLLLHCSQVQAKGTKEHLYARMELVIPALDAAR